MVKTALRTTSITLALPVLLAPPSTAGDSGRRMRVTGLDDWPADSVLEMGTLECPGTEPIWMGPFPLCPEGSNAHIRGYTGYSCLTGLDGMGLPEPRFTGVAYMTVNGNLDPTYSGPVWGRWRLVLSEVCDPMLLDDSSLPFWEGTWQGTRTRTCQGDVCTWIGILNMIGRGRGGPIHRAHIKGVETVTTLTPLPVPYELIPGFCPPGEPCPPEGVTQGVVKMKPRR